MAKIIPVADLKPGQKWKELSGRTWRTAVAIVPPSKGVLNGAALIKGKMLIPLQQSNSYLIMSSSSGVNVPSTHEIEVAA